VTRATAVLLLVMGLLGGADAAARERCTRTLRPGADAGAAVERARAGAVICLRAGRYPRIEVEDAHKARYVTVRSLRDRGATVAGVELRDASRVRIERLDLTDPLLVLESAHHLQIVRNEVGHTDTGMYFYGWSGNRVEHVRIAGNHIHDIDYDGEQGPGNGYGIDMVGNTGHFVIRGNRIARVAEDYIQLGGGSHFTVDRNTILGPSLRHRHPDAHADLWQIFGGGSDIAFTNNVIRRAGTNTGLLFQTGQFRNVRVTNNLFDHDSDGHSVQIYNATGLVFRHNTVVGSRWGVIFRDHRGEHGTSAGSGYRVERNIFEARDAPDVGTEGDAFRWGVYDYNVTLDGSASGRHSVRRWRPRWHDTTWYRPRGLPFRAGYRRP
jgi:nitrous oxidase accessory protein NosD